MQKACAVFSSVACPVLSYFSSELTNGAIIGEKVIENKTCDLIFSATFLPEAFLILRIIQRYTITMYIGFTHSAPYFVTFRCNDSSRHIFEKYSGYRISLKFFRWEPSCSMRTDRRMDRHTRLDEANRRFSQFYRRT